MGDTIKLSRVGGFSFAGVTVDNTDDIYLLDVDKDATPELRYTEFIVPKKHGSSRYDDSYADREISVVIGVYANTKEERKAKIRNLIAPMLSKEGKLIFADEPTLFFDAKIYNAIPTKETNIFTELTIIFNASPFMYGLYGDGRDLIINETYNLIIENMNGVLINKALWADVTTNTFKQLINEGNYETLPIIAITGTAQKISLAFDNDAFAFVDLVDETLFIDTEKMIVYSLNGAKKVSRLTSFNGEFPKIHTGINDVVISGTNFNVDIQVEYRNTYVV